MTDARRPGCLTAVCLFLGFAVVSWLLLGFTYKGDRDGWYPFHLVVQAIGIGVVTLGLWKMQRWSVPVFAIVASLVHILYSFTGLLNMETFLIYVFTLGPAVYFYNRMR